MVVGPQVDIAKVGLGLLGHSADRLYLQKLLIIRQQNPVRRQDAPIFIARIIHPRALESEVFSRLPHHRVQVKVLVRDVNVSR